MSEEEFINSGEKLSIAWKFPNGIVCACDKNGEQVGFLQGRYSNELHNKILKFSDHNTILRGFNSYYSNDLNQD